ncbi:MAG: flagellar hook-length control protein FliK [Anoxybacillus sp.]|nr:flagellar hook-length control protein FliK [Anoxybacillus sp.]MCL6586027.1 flagellar hook-length control protein FliK [Anoxybacillus sp.]
MIRPVAFPSTNMLASTALKPEAPAFAFSTLLANMKQSMPQLQESNPLPTESVSVDLSELYSQLQQLFASIPVEEGYMRQETLENPVISTFMQLLPPSLKEQVTNLFGEERPVEQVVEDEQALENDGTLLAIAFMLFQLGQRQNPIPDNVLEGVKERLVALFSRNDGRLHEKGKNAQPLLDQLIRTASKNEQSADFSGNVANRSVQTTIYPQITKELAGLPKEKPPASFDANVVLSKEPLIEETNIVLSKEPLTDREELVSLVANSKTSNYTISLPVHEQKGETQRSFTQQLTEIMKTGKFTKGANGQTQLVIRLHPEHLGTLTVKLIAQKDGELAAKIITNTTAAKELVEASIHHIRHIIPTENIIVERFDVWTQPEFAGMNRQQQQRQSKQPFEQEQPSEKSEQVTEEFADALQEKLNAII